MYDVNDIKELYDRLKEQYHRYKMDFSGDCLTLTLLHGKVEVNREGAKLYVNGKLYDEFTSDEVDDSDDLYELIELFLLQLQQLGMESGNETYITAKTKAARLGTRFMLLVSLTVSACLLALLSTHSLWWMLPVFACPAAAFIPLGLIHKKTFRKYWICPECGQPLPLDKKGRFPKMEYVSQCPHCGRVLEKAPEMEPLCLDSDPPKKQLKSTDNLPTPGMKWPCFLTGGITTVIALLLLPLLFFSDEPLDPVGVTVAVVLLLILLGFGLALLLCRHTEPEECRQPLVVLREQKMVTYAGMIVWVFGFIDMLLAILVAGTPPFDAGFTFFLALIGVPLTLLGTWMLLARRNRSLFVFWDNSIMYISSWGRVRNFEPGQIASVRMTVNRSIHLLDKNGKKLASVETNMQGAPRFAEWIESTDLTAALTSTMENQAKREAETEGVIQWREEYRTHWHDHIKAIRVGMWLVMLFFVVGTLIPVPLFLFGDIKFRTVMTIAAMAPMPFLVFCIVFAPVLLFGDRPKNATSEWNAMHVKVPLIPALLICLLYMGQVHHFWDHWVLQDAEESWLWLVRVLAVAAVVTTLLIWRTPKRMRLGAGIFIGMVSLCLAIGINYCSNAALCGPPRHYPAVIIDSHAEDPDKEDDDYTLTVLLDNDSQATIVVFEETYERAINGEPLDVCQRESPLGVILLDIHPPET